MTIDQLEMLEAIIITGSFQAAAARLNKSQPSLSVGIKKIEEEYNIQIFSRENYRAEITPQGHAFYQMAKESLRGFRRLHRFAKELGSGLEAEIKFQMDPLVPAEKISFLLQSCNETSVSLKIQSGILDESFQAVLNQEVDFGLGKYQEHEQVVAKKLMSIELIACYSNKLIAKKIHAADELLLLPQVIVLSKDTGRVDYGGQKTILVSDHFIKESLILNGFAWGRLPKEIIYKNRELRSIPQNLLTAHRLDFYLMRRKERALGKLGQIIWQSLESI